MKMHVAWSYNEGEVIQWVIAEVTKPRYQSIIETCVDVLENKKFYESPGMRCTREDTVDSLNWAIHQGTPDEFAWEDISREEVEEIRDKLVDTGESDHFIILDDVIGVYENEIDIDYREVE